MVIKPGGWSWLGGKAKRPTGTPAGVGDATVPSPPVAADRVNTANARQSRVLTVVDEPGGAEAAPASAARPKDRPVPPGRHRTGRHRRRPAIAGQSPRPRPAGRHRCRPAGAATQRRGGVRGGGVATLVVQGAAGPAALEAAANSAGPTKRCEPARPQPQKQR